MSAMFEDCEICVNLKSVTVCLDNINFCASALQELILAQNTQLTTIQQQIGGLSTQMTTIDGRIGAIEGRMDSIEG
jgi:hypothetical protein